VPRPCLNEDTELECLVIKPLTLKGGFCLTNPTDPGYQKAAAHRERYGRVVHRAAQTLGKGSQGEDHIDAVLSVMKAIDAYLQSYAARKVDYDNAEKGYTQLRQSVSCLRTHFGCIPESIINCRIDQTWPRQQEHSRLVLLKRAEAYHTTRLYMHGTYRRRSALDDQLLLDLMELSLSPYTRIRR